MTVSGAMTKARSPPVYGRKRWEKWRRGTNEGKRCLSRSESVEGPRTVKPDERLLQSEPGEFFFPGPRSHFSAFGHQPGAFFWLPFSFAGKEKGRPCSPVAQTVLLAVVVGYKPRVYPGFRVENRVTPYQVRDDKRRVFPGSRVGARDDRVGASGVRDDSACPPGNWGGHKKRAGGLSLRLPSGSSFKVAATYSPTCAVPSA